MNLRELEALRVDATNFLQQNGFVWRVCEVESAPGVDGIVTLSPGVCLCLDTLFGETSRVSGLVTIFRPGEQLITGQQVIHFPTIDPLSAAQELLLGDYEAFFTAEGCPIILEWLPDLQNRLRHYAGRPLPSHALRATLMQRIAESGGSRDGELF